MGHAVMIKKWALWALLAFGCSQAQADWVKVATTETTVFYLDTAMSKKVAGTLMVWILREHTSPRMAPEGQYRSSKDQLEINCRARRVRLIYSSDHPDLKGEGKQVHFEHGPMSWNDVAQNPVFDRIVNIACSAP
jgi:hypothetical protein